VKPLPSFIHTLIFVLGKARACRQLPIGDRVQNATPDGRSSIRAT
jgi:hypothetical protein